MKNYDKVIARKKIYSNNKYESDITSRLIRTTRIRIRKAI